MHAVEQTRKYGQYSALNTVVKSRRKIKSSTRVTHKNCSGEQSVVPARAKTFANPTISII